MSCSGHSLIAQRQSTLGCRYSFFNFPQHPVCLEPYYRESPDIAFHGPCAPLEAFARSTGEKTLRLPHGILKLRKGRDKVAVVKMKEFLKKAQPLGILRTVPESYTSDTQAVLAHIKRTGEVPAEIEYIPGENKFSYTTNGDSSNGGTGTERGTSRRLG